MSDVLNVSSVQRDITHLVCGKHLGSGAFRDVYEYVLDHSLVIKIENKYASFSNVMEWQVWQAVKDTKLAKWFAPCVHISGNGQILIMKKTTPADVLPKRVPSFFTDLKADNWGRLDGMTVCHDYGYNDLIEYGMSVGLKKAEWV